MSRTFLVIAHPGHELRVHHWLETTRPEVWVLTDGSGRSGCSRLGSTTHVLEATGAVPATVYGKMTDIDLYHAVLNFEHERFIAIVDQLAAALIQNSAGCVAGDAREGYNPAHDICRLVIDAAVRLVKRKTDRDILNYDFTLVGKPCESPDELPERGLCLQLDDAAFARKMSAARNYPELRAEVEAALQAAEENSFRTECLRPVDVNVGEAFAHEKPFYEEYGERQVSAGHYQDVLRYREHILPLAAALDDHVKRNR